MADTGRVIAGRYRLLAPIGRGAMGVVWRAHDQLLDREVAVKEVQIAETLTEAERANAFQRTLREAKTAARLNHPAVVTVYDVAEDGGRPWIVMQLVHAQSLDQVLATLGPLSARRAAEVGRQLLSALSVAHSAGVMHRDVKPSNVLLGEDDRAVLTDFGIATFQGDPRLTQTGMVMGSPGFTAPERIRGEDASPASDLWSLGATLYAAVEGHGPFERRGGAITTMSAIINEEAPQASTAGALGPVIAALLRREPGERPDARQAIRMINEVLPLMPDRGEAAAAGYEPTAVSAEALRRPDPGPEAPVAAPGATALDAAAGRAAEPHDLVNSGVGSSEGPGGPGPTVGLAEPEPNAPTTPQPGTGEPPRQPGAGEPPRYREEHPPDFSSWYSPPPRSSSGGSGQPGPVPDSARRAQPRPGPRHQPQPEPWAGGAPRRRRSGLWWKIALVVLAMIGVGAGAATVTLLNRHPSNAGHGTTPTIGATLPPADLIHAINQHLTGPPPAGYRSYSQAAAGNEVAGFTMDIPANWTVSTTGPRTTIADPDGRYDIHLLVDLTPHTHQDMLAEAEFIESRSQFTDYRRLGLARLTIRGTPGAWWKFTYLDNGVPQTALDLLFIENTASGPQSYALFATAPTSMWTQLRPVFDEEVRTFTPFTK
jgi:serine/threonine protein kinase